MSVANHFLLRIAGASFETAALLRQELPLTLWGSLDAAERDLQLTAGTFSQSLFHQIGHQTNPETRHALIRIRRSVFRLQHPRADDVGVLRKTLETPNMIHADLQSWINQIAGLEELRAKISQAVVGLPNNWVLAVRQIALSDRCMRSLWLANSLFYQDIVRIIQGPTPSRGRLWKDFLTLGSYVNRMAYKTVPFGLFTTVACGRFSWNSPSQVGLPLVTRERIGLKNSLCGELADAVVRSAISPNDWAVLLNDTITEAGDELRFLPVHPIAAGAYEEHWLAIQRGPALEAVVRELTLSPKNPCSLLQLVDRLAEQIVETNARPKIRKYLLDLIDLDFLRIDTGVRRNKFDPVAELLGNLETSNAAQTFDAKSDLSELYTTVSTLESGSEFDWPRIETRLTTNLNKFAFSGSSDSHKMTLSDVIHARCLAEKRIDLDTSLIAPFEENLGAIARLVPLFNLELGRTIDARAFSLERCKDQPQSFLRLYLEYQRHLERRNLLEPLNPLHSEQRAVRDRLVEHLRQSAQGDLHTVEVPKAIINSYGDLSASFSIPPAPSSVAFQCQLCFGRQLPMLVVNDVVPGFGALVATFADEQLGWTAWLSASVREAISKEMSGVECVNVEAVLGFDGQVHSSPFKRSIVFPSEYTGGDSSDISISQLSIRSTPEIGWPTLFVNGEREPVIPILFGSLSPHLLPPLVRFLGTFGCYQTPFMRLIDWFEAKPDNVESGTTRHYARVTFDNVILERETWCVHTSRIPGLQQHLSLEVYRELVRWKEHECLPDRGFVRILADTSLSRKNGRRKPFYLDWSDVRCVSQFHRSLRLSQGVVAVAELLPDEDSALIRTESGRHAAEFHLELYGGRVLRDDGK